jgi:hypothetical protein
VGVLLVIFVTAFLFLLFGTLFLAGSRVCSGPVTIQVDGQPAEGASGGGGCVTMVDWGVVLSLGSLTAVMGAGALICIGSLRALARRWESPLFSPSIWTAVSAGVLGLVVWALIANHAYARQVGDACTNGQCTSHYDFEPAAAIVFAVIVAVLAIPFLLSLRRLIRTWLSLRPAA